MVAPGLPEPESYIIKASCLGPSQLTATRDPSGLAHICVATDPTGPSSRVLGRPSSSTSHAIPGSFTAFSCDPGPWVPPSRSRHRNLNPRLRQDRTRIHQVVLELERAGRKLVTFLVGDAQARFCDSSDPDALGNAKNPFAGGCREHDHTVIEPAV